VRRGREPVLSEDGTDWDALVSEILEPDPDAPKTERRRKKPGPLPRPRTDKQLYAALWLGVIYHEYTGKQPTWFTRKDGTPSPFGLFAAEALRRRVRNRAVCVADGASIACRNRRPAAMSASAEDECKFDPTDAPAEQPDAPAAQPFDEKALRRARRDAELAAMWAAKNLACPRSALRLSPRPLSRLCRRAARDPRG
jgi:hypothetical protein